MAFTISHVPRSQLGKFIPTLDVLILSLSLVVVSKLALTLNIGVLRRSTYVTVKSPRGRGSSVKFRSTGVIG